MKEFTLLNPGPANTTETVRRALVTPDLCHREVEFFGVMREIREELTRLAGGEGSHRAVILTGSGTAAVEATICSVLEEGRGLLVIDNGVYGDRIRRMAEAHDIPHSVLKAEWTAPPRLADVDTALQAHPEISHVAVVHHETTTGLLNPLRAIGEIVARHRRGLIVDAVSSFVGEPLDVRRDQVAFLVSSSGKCLQAMPGLGFVIGERAALEALRARRPRSLYLDLGAQFVMQERDDIPFTPAVQLFFALRQALRELQAETVAGRQRRYQECARRLREGMEALGFTILVPPEHRSSTVTTFRLPTGLTYPDLHDALKARGFIIYAGQGPLRERAFRVANMGTLTPADMDRVLAAFREVLAERGIARVTV
jgi:2-aminoethylphosphonate-pyruvate transaminase